MSCKVKTKEVVILGEVLRTVDEVLAANGKPSILYNRIKEYLVNAEGIDVSSDAANHKISKKAYDEYSKIYTKAYREIYGNWQSGPKAAVVELDENGEPTFEDFITELGDRYNKTNFIEYYMFKTPEGIQKGLDYVGSTNYKDYNELVLKESIDVGLIDYELRSKYYTAYEIGQIFTKHSNTGYKSPYYDFKAISADGKIVKSNTDSMLNIPAEYKEGRNFTILAVPKNVKYNPETKSFSADPTNSMLHKMTDKLKESNKGNYEIDFFNHISVDTKDMIEVLSDYYKDSNSTYFRLLNNLSKFVENDSKTLLTSPQFFKFNSDTEIATGMYRPFSKFITMSTHFDDDIQFKTFVHEVVHSITMNDSGINFKNIDAKYRRELQELYDYALQSNPKLKDDYGMHNLNEFMACCFNRPSFIQKLSKIRAKNPDRFNNLWEEVVGLLKRMFKVFNGMDRDSLSLYDEVLSVTLDFAEALKQDRIYTENMLSPYGEYIFEDDFPYDDVSKIENNSKLVEFNQNYKEEHSIIHSLLKYQKGQSKFPEEKIRLYLKLKQKEIKVLEDKATRKDINKRINQKLSRYKKSGKFSDKELSYKIIHAIEELNEYIESNGDKDELADVIAQLKVLSKAMIKKKAKKAKDVSDNTPLSSVINRDDMSPSPSGITPTENTDITEDEIIKGSLGANKKRLIELLGTKMYSGDIADVTVKELFQNSFDAIKQNKKAGNISRGKINIITNEIDRTITIEDNGSGMDADILANAFFTIGGTYKGNLDPSERSGGLGLAKMAILFSSENIKINTVKDGKEYIVNTTPEDISNDNFDIKVTDAKGKPNGTKISIKIPQKKISNVTGESVNISFPSESSSIKSLKKYIVADNIDINVKHIRENYSGKIKTTDTTDKYKGLSEEVIKSLKPLFTVQTNWGEMEISYNPGDTLAYGSSSNVYILSSGIHQFTSYPLNRSIDNLGKDVIINIKPRVNSESAQYPFNNQREGFRSSASNDISNLQSILKMLNSKIGLSQVRDRFKSIHNLDKIDFDVSDKNIKVDYDLSPKSKRNYSEFLDETIKTIANKKGKGKIEISFSDKKTDEDVFTLKELTDEFESEKTDRSNLDSKRPVIHNNTNMVLEEDAIKFVVKFSSLLVDIKNDILESKGFLSKFGGNHPLSGKSIKDQFWGVSFDKDYSGVNVALDDEALLFINPFAHLSESVLENPRAEKIIAYTLRHIIFHELNHNFVRSEDASFTGHFPMVDAAAYALPNHDLMMMKLRELVADNLDTIKKYAARYKQSSNKESSLTGSSIQETDLGRPDRDTQDIERDDTSSFNERLLSDYNRLVRGTEVSDQINNFYQLNTQSKQAILSPSEPRKLSSILSDLISNNNASEQLKSLATMLNDIVSNTPADTEVKLVREDVVRGTEDENAPEGISIMKMKGLAIPATNEAPARILINDRLNNAETISTIIHEGLHMATMAELSTDSAKAKKFKNFYEKAKRNIIENGYDANMYALSSPDEFLTAVFTDSNFREILSSTEPVRKRSEILNLLYEALDLIKSIIGFKGDISLLEDSLLMSTELLQGIKEGDNVNPSRHMYPNLDAMASVTTREFNSNFTDKQKAVKDKIDKVKEIERGRIYVDSKEFIDQLGKRAGKNIKLLSKVKDGMTRYIIWDEKQQKEVIVQNRPSDFGQLLFAKSKNFDKVRANKDNNDMSSVRRRGMGTTLHFIMEQLIAELDSQNSNMELLKPDFGNMGTWEDFYKLNKNDFIRKVLQSGKASDIFNIVYNTRSNGTYKYTIDQDDLIDPTDDAPTLSNEDRTFSVDEKDLEQLMRLAFKTYFNVYETQASMSWNSKGPIGRPLVMTEAPVYSDKKDIKGTIDLLVVYDNGKVGHFDWKFMGLKDAMKKQKYVSQDELQKQKITGYNPDRWGYTYVRRTVMDKLYVKRDTFEQQVATYKDILNTEFKINKGDIVQSRVIPVNMMFAEKPTGETYQFTNDQGKVVTVKKKEETNALQFIDHDYELLQSISLAKELTGDVLLDRFLTNLYKERDKLNARLKVQRGNENIRNSLRDVEDAIDSIVVKKNIAHVAEKVYNIANVISNNLSKPRYIDIRTGEGTKTIENPEYINDEDLNYFQNILIMYSDLMMSSENKIRQLTELSEMTEDADKKQQYLDESEELKEVLSNQYRVTTNVLKEINEERDRRLLRITEEGMYTGNSNSYIVTVDKNTMINSGIGLTDRVAKYSDTNVFYRYYTALSEISHPHLKLYKDLMDNLNYSVKEYVDNTSGKIEKSINGLKEWAKRNNKSMSEVYDLLVMYNEDKDDYMLLKPYTKELIQDTISAREDKNIEWLKKHMEFDKKKFNQARENYKKSYTKIYANKKDVDEKMQEFDEAYNPESSDYAYYNKNNRYLKYNEYALKQYKSSDYEYIMKQKELREFYNIYKDVMSDISNNLLTSGTYVDEYFIPNVRKDFIDKVVQDGVFKLDGLSSIKELIQRANDIRENDSEYGYQSNTEEVIDIIPLQFKDRIPGDLSLKSKDLGKSLLMFAYSSKMHQLSKDIEGISVGLKMSLATTKLMKKDMYGNIVIGSEVDADENTNLYKMLDGYINKYIYGRNLQELGEILGSKERTKWLMDLMSYQSKVSLAFNHLSLLGGHINAESQILTEAARGKHFTKKIWAESEKEVIKSSTKAVLAYEFFEVSAEGNSGLIYEKANKLSLSKLRSKYNKSLAYAGQRKSDDMIDKVYVTSMMKNYILHPNGKTIFPKQEAKLFTKGTEYEGREDELKTMWETMQVDESSDVEGLPMKIMRGDGKEEITKEQYIKFRNRIRSLASKAKGNYNSEDSYLYGTNLALRALMQYRGWIPAYVKERVGAAQYSSTTDDIEVGRYRVFLGNLIGEGLVPSIKKLMKLLPLYLGDLVTFNKFNLAQPSEDYLIKSFNTWANNNPGQYEELLNNFKDFDDPEAMAREKWKEAMQGQIKKTMVEVRNYLAMSAAALAIGFGVGEDELDDRPFVRELVNVINRAKMEIGFFFMPTEMLKLVQRSPLPVFSVLSDVVKLAGNSVEETKDFILGAEHNKTIDIFNISDKGMHLDFFEESSDRSPRFNYTFRAIPGVRGISQFLEFFESKDDDKTTIYEYLFGDDNTIYTR